MGMSGVAVAGRASSASEPVSVAAVTRLLCDHQHPADRRRDFGQDDADGRKRVAIVNDAPAQIAPLSSSAPRSPAISGDRDRDYEDTRTRRYESGCPRVHPLAQTIGSSYAFGRLTIWRGCSAPIQTLVPAVRQAVWALGSDVVIDEVR
jgi:hypothetical protein